MDISDKDFWVNGKRKRQLGEIIVFFGVYFIYLYFMVTYSINVINQYFTTYFPPIAMILFLKYRYFWRGRTAKEFFTLIKQKFGLNLKTKHNQHILHDLIMAVVILYTLFLTLILIQYQPLYQLSDGLVRPDFISITASIIPNLIFSLLFQLFAVALYEEFIFRGYLLNSINHLIKNKSNSYFAVIISSVVFAIFHIFSVSFIPLNLEMRLIQTFLGGMIFGFYYLRSQNLIRSSMMHAGLNTLNEILAQTSTQIISIVKEITSK